LIGYALRKKPAPNRTESRPRLGFIGVGKMGGPIARRLLADDHDVTVYDVRSAALRPLVKLGARAARSPREVAARADIVCTCLPTLEAIRAVTLGATGICHGRRVRVYIDLSTTGPRFAREIAAGLARHGIAMVDAPVSGGVAGAAAGTLAVMASGDARLVRRVRPLLDIVGKVFYLGRTPGQGQTMKLINNLLSAAALAITSEGFVMGVKAGLDPDVMLDAINAGSGRNSATLEKFPRSVLTRRFDFGADIAIFEKDLKLCLEEAARLGVTMWTGTTVRELWAHASRLGGARRDITALITYLEDWAGVKVIGKAARGKARA